MASEYSSTTGQLLSKASQALGYASGSAGRVGAITKPTLKAPSLNYKVAANNFGAAPKFSDLFDGADNTNSLIATLDDQVDAWLAKYFPAINGEFKTLTEDWCANVISGVKPFGVDVTIFELVWHQARDRAYRTANSEQRTLEQNFSSRGFSLPPGALIDAIGQSEYRGTQSIMDVSREQAIKDADIKVDLLKHATALAAQLKAGILNTSADFFRAYYSVHDHGNDVARIRAQAYQSYYSALSSYYNVETNWEELRLRAAQAGVEATIANDRNQVSLYSGDGVPMAQATAARAFADVSASALAAAGTLVAQIETV